MEPSGADYKIDCNNLLKKNTGETGSKLKEKMKEHENDGEKLWKDKKITRLSQHMKITGHFPA